MKNGQKSKETQNKNKKVIRKKSRQCGDMLTSSTGNRVNVANVLFTKKYVNKGFSFD